MMYLIRVSVLYACSLRQVCLRHSYRKGVKALRGVTKEEEISSKEEYENTHFLL